MMGGVVVVVVVAAAACPNEPGVFLIFWVQLSNYGPGAKQHTENKSTKSPSFHIITYTETI